MAKPTASQCHALTTYFVSKYNEVLGRSVTVNRNKSRWGFESILLDFTPAEARELIDFYLEHYSGKPSIDEFFYNYEKVAEAKEERARSEASAAARREATAQRLEEWRNRWQNQKTS